MVRYTLQAEFQFQKRCFLVLLLNILALGAVCCIDCSQEETQMEFYVFPRISPEGVDIVLDCLCGENTGKGLGLLKPLGTYILYGRYGVYAMGDSWLFQLSSLNSQRCTFRKFY